MFIGVSGLIGVGKSTFTKQLAGHFGESWKTYFEPVKTNPYLEDFYKDIPRWTFQMQMFLLAKRFEQHQEVIWDPCHRLGGGIIQDRTIYEDSVFARMHREDGLMDDRDWDTYISHFNIMKRYLVYPDVIVYLRTTPDIAMERINSRGRGAEEGMEMAYLNRLYEGYEDFAAEMGRYTVLVTLDWNEFKPVEEAAEAIMSAAETNQKFLRSIRRI